MKWQPIESAPKDGTVLILYSSQGMEMGSWKKDENYRDQPAKWFSEEGDDWSTGYYYCPMDPTHWMPLPAPPKN